MHTGGDLSDFSGAFDEVVILLQRLVRQNSCVDGARIELLDDCQMSVNHVPFVGIVPAAVDPSGICAILTTGRGQPPGHFHLRIDARIESPQHLTRALSSNTTDVLLCSTSSSRKLVSPIASARHWARPCRCCLGSSWTCARRLQQSRYACAVVDRVHEQALRGRCDDVLLSKRSPDRHRTW